MLHKIIFKNSLRIIQIISLAGVIFVILFPHWYYYDDRVTPARYDIGRKLITQPPPSKSILKQISADKSVVLDVDDPQIDAIQTIQDSVLILLVAGAAILVVGALARRLKAGTNA
jgi:hypothetical protein